MKKYLIKVLNKEVYVKVIITGGKPFIMPILTENKKEAGIFPEDKAKVFAIELNDLNDQFGWLWKIIEIEEN